MEQTTLIDPSNATATGTDAADIDAGDLRGITEHVMFSAEDRLAVNDEGDIVGGATDIGGGEIRETDLLGEIGSADCATGQTRGDHLDRSAFDRFDGRDATG